MSSALASIPEEVSKKYSEFKFRKSDGSSAIISKINAKTKMVEIEQEIKSLNLDELSDEICESEPRYILVSYEYVRDDGRKSYPYVLIYSSPRNSPHDLKMLYASTLHHFSDVSQVYELHDLEDLNEEWLVDEMKKKGI